MGRGAGVGPGLASAAYIWVESSRQARFTGIAQSLAPRPGRVTAPCAWYKTLRQEEEEEEEVVGASSSWLLEGGQRWLRHQDSWGDGEQP